MTIIKIKGIVKSATHSFYSFEKKEEFIIVLKDLLILLGFNNETTNIRHYENEIQNHMQINHHNQTTINKSYPGMESLIDKHYFFHNKEYTIDIILGLKRIFLIITSKTTNQKEITKQLDKYCTLI